MKKAERRLQTILDENEEEVIVYEPITVPPYPLKLKYRINKPT